MQHIEVTQVLSKFYKKQGKNMKPQSSTVFDVELRRNEGFSVFSNRISFNGNNRKIVFCFIA